MITSFLNNTRNFPDSKEFAGNQYKADQLVVNTLPKLHKKYSKRLEDLEQTKEKKTVFINSNEEFLCEGGFTPEYLNEKETRRKVMNATPILTGLSITTGLYIIFGTNIFLTAILGLILAYASFYLALYDKVLKSEDEKKWTFLLFLAIDAVLLIVGLFIGISNNVPSIYLMIHVIICGFALILNYSMIKHAENFNQDKIKEKKKVQLDLLKEQETKIEGEVSKLKMELGNQMSDLGSQAVILRAGFVAHNYDPSTLRMSLDTRMALNQFFGYDLFPVIDAIVPPDYIWERRAITKWNEDTSSKYPEILSVHGPFSSTATFTVPSANRQIGNGDLIATPGLNESNNTLPETNSNASTAINNNASVFQSPESENEL